MNMFARFDENPAMTLQDIKKTKRYGRTDACTDTGTDAHTHARTHTRTHTQTKFAGGIKIVFQDRVSLNAGQKYFRML